MGPASRCPSPLARTREAVLACRALLDRGSPADVPGLDPGDGRQRAHLRPGTAGAGLPGRDGPEYDRARRGDRRRRPRRVVATGARGGLRAGGHGTPPAPPTATRRPSTSPRASGSRSTTTSSGRGPSSSLKLAYYGPSISALLLAEAGLRPGGLRAGGAGALDRDGPAAAAKLITDDMLRLGHRRRHRRRRRTLLAGSWPRAPRISPSARRWGRTRSRPSPCSATPSSRDCGTSPAAEGRVPRGHPASSAASRTASWTQLLKRGTSSPLTNSSRAR